MKGIKTHMARDAEVKRTYFHRGKERSVTYIETVKVCTGELHTSPTYWLFKNGILTKRWKNVTCKSCLRMKEWKKKSKK